ncbi:MAG: hypothetical protein RLN82_00690, partial [Pseudomonadales bacterium]
LGFSGAWSKAVNYFVESRGLNGNEALSLLARKPDKSVFTGILLQKTQSRGHKLTPKRLKDMLDAEFE